VRLELAQDGAGIVFLEDDDRIDAAESQQDGGPVLLAHRGAARDP
jgi:hypothetical protein